MRGALESPCCYRQSSSLLLHTENHGSGCANTAALDFLGILSTYTHFTPTCRQGTHNAPVPIREVTDTLWWHEESRPQGQHSDHRSGLPSCHQPGATSMRRKVRQDLASGITGAEQRMQDRRLAVLDLLRGEKGFNGCTPLPEGNSGDKQDTLFPTKGQHRADTGSKMGNSNQTWGKKPLWWDCLSTGTGCSERLWKYHSYRYILKYVPFNWTSSQWPHLPLTTTFVQGGRHQRSL